MIRKAVTVLMACGALSLVARQAAAGGFSDLMFLDPANIAIGGLYMSNSSPGNALINPAAASNIHRKKITTGLNFFPGNLRNNFVSYSQPTQLGALTARVNYLTDDTSVKDIYYFSALAGLGIPVFNRYGQAGSAGVSVKVIGEKHGTDRRVTLTSGAGFTRQLFGVTNAGVSVTNIAGDYTIGDVRRHNPVTLQMMISSDIEGLNLAAAYEARYGKSSLLKLGTEFDIMNVPLRTGFKMSPDGDNSVSIGTGAVMRGLVLNYCLLFSRHPSIAHLVSVGLRFGEETEASAFPQMGLERLYRAGIASYNKGNLLRAAEQFNRVSREDPDYKKTRLYLQQIEEAIAQLSTRQPRDEHLEGIGGLLESADGYYESGDYESALRHYRTVLFIDPSNEEAQVRSEHIQRIINEQEAQREREAQERQQRWINRQLEDYASSGRGHLNRGDYRKAIEYFNQGAAYARRHGMRTWVERFNQHTREARERLSEDHFIEGHRYYQLNRFNEAISAFRKALEYSPQNEAARRMISELETKITQVNEREAEKMYELGLEAAARQDNSLAAEYFEKALEFYPDHASARRALERITAAEGRSLDFLVDEGNDLYGRGEYRDALRTFERVLMNDPGNTEASEMISRIREKAEDLYIKGIDAHRDEDYSLAEKYFLEAIELNPQHSAAQRALERIRALQR